MKAPSDGEEVLAWAKHRDYVAWIEASSRDEGRLPGHDIVLIVSCRMDEIEQADLDFIAKKGWRIDPLTPELFASDRGISPRDMRSNVSSRPQGQRAKSEAESPVKIVWATADAMADAPRAEVIAACIEKGVNKATAQTQYYKWAKAKRT